MSAGRFNLSALAVRERSVTLFLIILISVAGLVAFFGLGRAEDPPLYGQANDGHYRLARRHRAGDAGIRSPSRWKTTPGVKVVRSHGDLYPAWHGVDHPVAAGSDPAFRGAGAVLSGAQKSWATRRKTCLPASPAR